MLFENAVLSLLAKHLLLKNGVWFYYRRIPAELRRHYAGKRHIRKSLKTGDARVAAKKAVALASADDALWSSMRTPEAQEVGLTTSVNREAALRLLEVLDLKPGDAHRRPGPGEVFEYVLDDHFGERYGGDYQNARDKNEPFDHILTAVELEAVRLVLEDPEKPRVLLSDALSVYLRNHDKGQDHKFARDTTRAVDHVKAAVGDWPLSAYKREHANAVRDHLLAKDHKTQTVRRRLNTIKAVFNTGLREFDLTPLGNPFAGTKIARERQDSSKRRPFSDEQLRTIAAACREADDDIRHIVAIQMDTGTRLGEVVGVRVEDVELNHATTRPLPVP